MSKRQFKPNWECHYSEQQRRVNIMIAGASSGWGATMRKAMRAIAPTNERLAELKRTYV